MGPKTLLHYYRALKGELSMAPKRNVNFWAVKGAFRNVTHEKYILFLQINLIRCILLVCLF
jgi:hypothetical protein